MAHDPLLHAHATVPEALSAPMLPLICCESEPSWWWVEGPGSVEGERE